MNIEQIKALIREVPDFPKPGINFKDITPLLQNGPAFSAVIDALAMRYRDANLTCIAGPESRGFIFGAALAARLGVGLLLIRKPGKLPHEVVGLDYELEYGTDRLEIHADALSPGDRVLLIDDLLATGGTAAAAIQLLKSQEAEVVEAAFLIELAFLDGKKHLAGTPIYSMISY